MQLSTFILKMEECEVRCPRQSVNPREAAGPDGVPGCVLRTCAEQLAAQVWLQTCGLYEDLRPECHPLWNPPT